MNSLKKIILETTNFNEEEPINSKRVNLQIVMDQIPKDMQKEIETEFNKLFEKIVELVPDTTPAQGLHVFHSN